MLYRHFHRNGRKVIYGKGSYNEIESLNIEKDFETALNTLYYIRTSRKTFFGINEPEEINRKIYGKRKTSRE